MIKANKTVIDYSNTPNPVLPGDVANKLYVDSTATVVNPTTPKDGDVQISAGPVIKIYATGAWRQVFPAIYS